ncbi:MAG: DNA repair protein RecO [Chloroflexota bacterium]
MIAGKQPRIYRSEALVLKASDFGEADRLLTLFTPDKGKLRAIAKGVRKLASRKSGHLDLFMRSTVLIASGRSLDIVTQAELLETFLPIRSDLRRLAHSHYVAELVDKLAGEHNPNQALYAKTLVTLRRLAVSDELDLVTRAFELHSLHASGYRPQLHRCLHCNNVIVPQVNRFSASLGGVLCDSCSSVDTSAPEITVDALKIMRHLQTNEARILEMRGIDESVKEEVERHLQKYITFRLESRVNSRAFLARMNSKTAGA